MYTVHTNLAICQYEPTAFLPGQAAKLHTRSSLVKSVHFLQKGSSGEDTCGVQLGPCAGIHAAQPIAIGEAVITSVASIFCKSSDQSSLLSQITDSQTLSSQLLSDLHPRGDCHCAAEVEDAVKRKKELGGTSEEKGDLPENVRCEQCKSLSPRHRICEKIALNAMQVAPDEDIKKGDQEFYEGIYPLVHLINHSCLPNLIRTANGKAQSFRACQMIEDGQPLTISYLTKEELMEPASVRRQICASRFDFDCACQRCTSEKPTNVAHIPFFDPGVYSSLCGPNVPAADHIDALLTVLNAALVKTKKPQLGSDSRPMTVLRAVLSLPAPIADVVGWLETAASAAKLANKGSAAFIWESASAYILGDEAVKELLFEVVRELISEAEFEEYTQNLRAFGRDVYPPADLTNVASLCSLMEYLKDFGVVNWDALDPSVSTLEASASVQNSADIFLRLYRKAFNLHHMAFGTGLDDFKKRHALLFK